MGKKQFFIFLALAVVLGVVYFSMDSSDVRRGAPKEVRLFDDVSADAISRVQIEQGTEKIELLRKDNSWTMPSRAGYAADSTKVRAFLLKLFDLSVSQQVPLSQGSEAEPQLEKLGLVEASIAKGQSKVTLYDAQGKSLGALRIGIAVPGRKSDGFSGRGQYIRRDEKLAAYATSLPLDLSAKSSFWILGDLLTVLQNTVYQVQQFSGAEPDRKKEFSLAQKSLKDALESKNGNLQLEEAAPEGKIIDENTISQIGGALENLRATDVWPKDASEVKDLVFDSRAVFRTTSGLVYTISTASQGEKNFAKIDVDFDEQMVQQVKKAHEEVVSSILEAAAKATPTPTPDPSSAASPSPSGSATTTTPAAPTAVPTPAPPKAASAEEAKQLKEKFAAWVYELPSYQAGMLRKKLDNVFMEEKKEAPQTP